MKLYLFSLSLFGNLPPPSYKVTLPSCREWVYEYAAWVFAALAVMAGGLWYARRQRLQPALRRALLWLAAGSAAVAYTAGWLWVHRNDDIVPPNLFASIAVWMYGVWVVGASIVVIAGWRHVRGSPASRGWITRAGRPLAFAIVTIALSLLLVALGFQPALVILFPGLLLIESGFTTEFALPIFICINVALWYTAWAVVLWVIQIPEADVARVEASLALAGLKKSVNSGSVEDDDTGPKRL